MDEALKQEVLAEYRQLRGTGAAPYAVMGMLRDGAANMIAQSVAIGADPPAYLIDRWQTATDYLNSMATRPRYWWQRPAWTPPRPAAHIWPWQTRSTRQSRRKIRP